MSTAPIRLMKDRRREMIPIDKIKVINSRTRDESQFALNVQSIDAVGQIKDIRVNDKFLQKEGFYELICGEGRLIAQKRLGKTQIFAEVVTCTRKQAYVESLVENLARSRPGTMDFARELKRLRDEGWDFERIAKVACRSAEYVRQYIRLVENGEERLIHGVEHDVIPISFAIMVAQSDDANVQNVLMDAFDQGIVTSSNFAKVRAIINARIDRRKRKGGARLSERVHGRDADGGHRLDHAIEGVVRARGPGQGEQTVRAVGRTRDAVEGLRSRPVGPERTARQTPGLDRHLQRDRSLTPHTPIGRTRWKAPKGWTSR